MFSDEAIEEMAKMDSALNNKLAALIPGGKQIIIEGQDIIFMWINLKP